MTAPTAVPVEPGVDCWSLIGISGDRSCPELERFIHCRNCPVFATAARRFFDRPAPEGYQEEWTRLLGAPIPPPAADDLSVLIFRLTDEWLALPARVIVEVTNHRPVHRIPHRTNERLVGMVNLRGQLQLMVSLHGVLGIQADEPGPAEAPGGPKGPAPRLVVICRDGQTWVFATAEVGGVHRFSRTAMSAVPSTLANPKSSFSQAVIPWEGRSVGLLDDQRLFAALKGLGR
jgi:chemotaxis-related protein WspD